MTAPGLCVLGVVFVTGAAIGVPMGLAMLAAGFAYLMATHQDVGLVVDQTMNGLYNNYLLLAVPLFIFVANVMNAIGRAGAAARLRARQRSGGFAAASRMSTS